MWWLLCFLFVSFRVVIGDNTGHKTLAPVLLTVSYMAVKCPANICGGYCVFFLFVSLWLLGIIPVMTHWPLSC